MTAIRLTLWLARAPAILLGTYPSSLAALRTFSRVASDTSPRPRSTLLTVISDTPEASDTSLSVSARPRTSFIAVFHYNRFLQYRNFASAVQVKQTVLLSR